MTQQGSSKDRLRGRPARRAARRCALACLALVTCAGVVFAQSAAVDGQAEEPVQAAAPAGSEATDGQAGEAEGAASASGRTGTVFLEPLPPPEPPALPGVDRLAQALADPATRESVLLDLVALLTLRDTPQAGSAEEASEREATLRGHRAWLDTLVGRYRDIKPRPPVLDPAAWQVQVQLDRVGLSTTQMAAPLGPGQDVLIDAVLDRSSPELAAATLPELLWRLEVGATRSWAGLLRRLANDPWLAVALVAASPGWLDWPERPAAAGEDAAGAERESVAVAGVAPPDPEGRLLERARTSLGVMLKLATSVGPPDPARLADVRRDLLTALPDLDHGHRAHAESLLHLAGLVDGLYQEDLLHFAAGLLAITARLQDEALFYPGETRELASWLAQVLPGLSSAYGRAFSTVDPRLNSVIATTFDVARALTGEVSGSELTDLRVQLADAVGGLVLMIQDLGFYFDQPIRDPIAGGVDACTGVAGGVDAEGNPAMTRELFDDCQETLVSLANFEARETQIAGNVRGPFGVSQLRRELGLVADQRINYGIGYLGERYDTGCELPSRPLPNPLEWAYLATFMAWFAEQSPVYFRTPENEQRLQRMRRIGRELVDQLEEQVDCLAGAGANLSDPVERIAADFEADFDVLARALSAARGAFREERLAAGADIRLDAGSDQSTAYRPAELLIDPCDPAAVCEMSGSLSSTRALTGLFDAPYLVADQARLGTLEVCYDNMGWVDRRMEPVRPGDENVANFFGRLGFELRGRFTDGSGTQDLFAFRFTSPEEYHYLFSAQQQEVLDDACPMEWVGSRIVTGLPRGRAGIVPDRLTYLSAARALPSRLLEANWDRGAEWRDWFVTGLGVEALPLAEPPSIGPALDEHLASLYRQEQTTLFDALNRLGDDPLALAEELAQLTTTKLLLRSQMMLFYPQVLVRSDRLREALAGQNGLLDRRLILRARQADLPVDALLVAADDRLEAFRRDWRALPESVRRRGSVADSVSHAIVRLDAIHDQFFAAPAEAAPPVRSALLAAPGGEGEDDGVGDAEREL